MKKLNKRVTCIILARKNSKRIKNKNTLKINNKPLIQYTIESVNKSKSVNNSYLFTDDFKIKKLCEKKVKFIKRPKVISGDKISSDETIFYFIKKNLNLKINDTIVFLQPTSPIRDNNDIDKALNIFFRKKFDTLFSCYKDKSLFWIRKGNKLKPINYTPKKRQREQNMDDQYIENGSIYIFNREKFLKQRTRLFGKIGVYEMRKDQSFQVDQKIDIKIIKKFINDKK